MPMYDFVCEECGNEFVVMTSLAKRDEPQTCPVCESKDTERIVSIPAAIGSETRSNSSSCGGSGRFT